MNAVDVQTRATAAPRRRTFQRVASWVLIVMGALFVLLMVAAPSDPKTSDPKDKEGENAALVLGAIMLVAGLGWLLTARRSDATVQLRYEEKAILAVAARYGGRATIAQIALETQLSMNEAEAAINRLCGKNIAQPDLMDDGSVVYQFGMLN